MADYSAAADRDASRLADHALHQAIARATHNARLVELSGKARREVSLGFDAEPYTPERPAPRAAPAPALAEAVIAGEPDAAARIAAEHFSLTEDMLRELHARIRGAIRRRSGWPRLRSATVNGIELNYRLEGDGEETIVLINGLADDLETWALQVDDFLAAGYRVLRFDNRGIGASSAPAGPYSSEMLADDAKALVDSLGVHRLPPDGRVDGRHDRPGIRAGLPGRPALGHVRVHLRGAGPVLLADVRHVGGHGAGARACRSSCAT